MLKHGLFATCVALLLAAVPCLGAAKADLSNVAAPPLVIADLDGDHTLDFAIGSRSGNSTAGFLYRIDLGLSGSAEASSFTVFDRQGTGLNVSTVDLDGDHDLDLVITSQPFHRPVGVWINDGTGKFERGDSSRYPASIWSDSHSLQNTPLEIETYSIATPRRQPAFHLVVFARAQIPAYSARVSRTREAVFALPVCLKVPPSLRAPPATL